MFTHIVMLKLDPAAGLSGVREVADGLAALVGKVPGLVACQVGTDLGHGADNASVIGQLEFESEEAWRSYGTHPSHKALIAESIAPILVAKSAMQVMGFEETKA